MFYFDHAAATPMTENALTVLRDSTVADFANPSAAHKLGRDLMGRIEKVRQHFLQCLQADDFNFFFTSSATESNNTVVKGLTYPAGSKILYSPADHPSLFLPIENVSNVQLVVIPLDAAGRIDYVALSALIDSSVSLLAISQVNNHSGTRQDIDRVGAILKSKAPKAHLHVDGVQAFGKLPFTLKSSHVDSYSISAHKIGGPKGISGVYVRKPIVLDPLLLGGGQEMGMRSSTVAAPLIYSFHAASLHALTELEEKMVKMQRQRQLIQDSLKAAIPSILFPFESCSPYILTLILPGLPSDIMMRQLERQNVFVSSSSACSSRINGHNSVYASLHIDPSLHKCVLRLSFSAGQKEEEFEAFVTLFIQAYRGLSHLIKG